MILRKAKMAVIEHKKKAMQNNNNQSICLSEEMGKRGSSPGSYGKYFSQAFFWASYRSLRQPYRQAVPPEWRNSACPVGMCFVGGGLRIYARAIQALQAAGTICWREDLVCLVVKIVKAVSSRSACCWRISNLASRSLWNHSYLLTAQLIQTPSPSGCPASEDFPAAGRW